MSSISRRRHGVRRHRLPLAVMAVAAMPLACQPAGRTDGGTQHPAPVGTARSSSTGTVSVAPGAPTAGAEAPKFDLKTMPIHQEGRDSANVTRKIADASTAAPGGITAGASFIDRAVEEGGVMLPLRRGGNGWVCVPDDPITPTRDPMCLNGVAQRWASGWYTNKPEFRPSGIGIGYQLQGGAIASEADPFQRRPAGKAAWIIEPPHVILILPDTTGLGAWLGTPRTGLPWVSWKGTPYVHLNVPVGPPPAP